MLHSGDLTLDKGIMDQSGFSILYDHNMKVPDNESTSPGILGQIEKLSE
jgi:hypothetical protein